MSLISSVCLLLALFLTDIAHGSELGIGRHKGRSYLGLAGGKRKKTCSYCDRHVPCRKCLSKRAQNGKENALPSIFSTPHSTRRRPHWLSSTHTPGEQGMMKVLPPQPRLEFNPVAFSPNGCYLAVASGQEVVITDICEQEASEKKIDRPEEIITSIGWDGDDRILVGTLSGRIHDYPNIRKDLKSRPSFALKGEPSIDSMVDADKSGTFFVLSRHGRRLDYLDVNGNEGGGHITLISAVPFFIRSIAFSPSKTHLAIGGSDGVIRIYRFSPDWEENAPAAVELKGDSDFGITALAWIDSTHLVSGPGRRDFSLPGSWEAHLHLWDVREQHCVARAKVSGQVTRLLTDGKNALVATFGSLGERNQHFSVVPHEGFRSTTHFGLDTFIRGKILYSAQDRFGKRFATVSGKGNVTIWNWSGEQSRTLEMFPQFGVRDGIKPRIGSIR